MGAPLEKRVALASLNRFLDDWIKPIEIDQVRGVDAPDLASGSNEGPARRRRGAGSARSSAPSPRAPTCSPSSSRERRPSRVGLRTSSSSQCLRTSETACSTPTSSSSSGTAMTTAEVTAEAGTGGTAATAGMAAATMAAGGGDDDQEDFCQYKKCVCANPDNCLCCSTTVWGTTKCPKNQCENDDGCPGGGGGEVIEDLFGSF